MVLVDEGDGLEVILLRLGDVPECLRCETEIVPGSIGARIESYRSTERFGGLRVSSLLVIDTAKVVGNFRVGWRPRGRAFECLFRFAVARKKVERPGFGLESR